MKKISRFLPIIVLVILSYYSVKPLFINGFFPMHDDAQVARVYEMTQALVSGQFPVRWVKDLGYGYGYPIFNFYSPLPYYIGGILGLLGKLGMSGIDSLVAAKLMFGFGIVLAGISMYFFARELFGKYGGMLSAILYLYAPYHAIQIYVRGAVCEFWAYAFLPLFFLSIYKLKTAQSKRWIV